MAPQSVPTLFQAVNDRMMMATVQCRPRKKTKQVWGLSGHCIVPFSHTPVDTVKYMAIALRPRRRD